MNRLELHALTAAVEVLQRHGYAPVADVVNVVISHNGGDLRAATTEALIDP